MLIKNIDHKGTCACLVFLSHACLRLYKRQNGHPCIPWNPINFVARIAQKICINICFATKMTKNLRRNRDSQGKGAGVGVSCRGDEHPKNQRRLKKKKTAKRNQLENLRYTLLVYLFSVKKVTSNCVDDK